MTELGRAFRTELLDALDVLRTRCETMAAMLGDEDEKACVAGVERALADAYRASTFLGDPGEARPLRLLPSDVEAWAKKTGRL